MLEVSNYWDDFQIRVNNTIDCMNANKLPNLERLTVHLTERCNFRCEYCNMCFSEKTLDEAVARKIIDDYSEMGGRIIHFTGGEPSVVPYVESIFKYAHDKGLQVSSNTNAFKRMDTTYIDKLKTSFDTPYRDVFNKTMGTDCFDKVVENMKYYSQTMTNKMLSITAVLNHKTYKSMYDLAKFVNENFDVYNLYFSNYKGNNAEFAFTEEQITDMFENYIPKTLQYLKDTGNEYSYKQLSLYKPSDFANVDVRFEDNKRIPCYIQLSELTVNVDGKCHNCSHLFRDKVKPQSDIYVQEHSLKECFELIKGELKGDYVCMSDKCLNGCNTNLIGFNKTVHRKEYI